MENEVKQANPLQKFFRQPAISMTLPTNGRYWEEGSLEMNETGELPVYPMTNRDEILIRTPDTLFNGQSMVEVIQSCIPSIKNAWKMPSPDVDSALIAIRIASNGHNMDFEASCPHCNEHHTFAMDLRVMLGNIKCPDFETPHTFGSLTIKFKPQQYIGMTRSNKINFEIARFSQALEQMGELDQKTEEMKRQMEKLIQLNHTILAESTESITINGDNPIIVKDYEYILEFYDNIKGSLCSEIQDTYTTLTKTGQIPPQQVTCDSCKENFEMTTIFDYSNFFANGS